MKEYLTNIDQMTKMLKKENKKGGLAISQIIILIVGIIAIAYAVGSSIEEVSALKPLASDAAFVDKLFYNFFGKNRGELFNQVNLDFPNLGPTAGQILQTIGVAVAAVALVWWILDLIGASDRNTRGTMIVTITTAGAVTVGSFIASLTAVGGPPGWLVGAVILAAAGIYMLISYQTYSQEIFTFQPTAWEAPDGGINCADCNDLRYGCDEYQCRTFGKACVIVNKGTEHEKCFWNNSRDSEPPFVSAMNLTLLGLSEDYYDYIDSGVTLPPERGVKINYDEDAEGCLPAFSSITLGVNTSELAICKIDIDRKPTFDEVSSYMSEGNVLVNDHTLTLPNSATPSAEAMTEVGWDVENGRQHEYYIRCKDANGNVAPMNFVIEFCVTDTPDTQAPEILSTNYLPESYLLYDQKTAPLEVYTDEPADCRWDYQDLDYENMVHEMDCPADASEYLYAFTYGCTGELEGLSNNVDNKFYIRCKDKPWWEEGDEGQRYTNRDSHELTLKGTIPLLIDSIKVNGQEGDIVVRDSREDVKVEIEVKTFAGAEEGKAKCGYEFNGLFYNFYNDGNLDYVYSNTQTLWLPEGDNYEYPIKCYDRAGNSAEETIRFDVETDFGAPVVVRAYYEGGSLKIITSEPAQCVYSTNPADACTYLIEDGISMSSSDDITHSVGWNTDNTLYVKCEDEYGNPPPRGCSIILRPFEFF